jgi:curved DNA-binding protein CbpA
MMKTLYELLDARPNDDAKRLRAAYRRAAKASHPDNNPGDPDAPQKFRQLVRANAILSDERQRAIYDRLLEIARQQQGSQQEGSERERGILSTIRKIAPDAFVIAILSAVFIGGYLLVGHMFGASSSSAPVIEVSRREPAQPAEISTEPSDTIGRAESRDKLGDVGATGKPADPETSKPEASSEAAPPEAAAPAAKTASAPAPDAPALDAPAIDTPAIDNVPTLRDFGVNDARYYRERGVAAYRKGNFYLALVNFNLAIDLDPDFAEAYVDRGIVLHRMGDRKRAFADIDQANRIDAARPKTMPPTASAP